jgi:transcriptional regulator with XRE-family HTH domain
MVRGYRRRSGWTQEELAERSGIGVRGLRNIETGRVATCRPGTVRLLADALGLTEAERDVRPGR